MANNRVDMRWFWVAADGQTVVSLNHQLRGEELARCQNEGWHRLYNNIWAYASEEELAALGAVPAPPAPIHSGSVTHENALAHSTVAALTEAGITPAETPYFGDDALLSIKGIGAKSLAAIRDLYPVENAGTDIENVEEVDDSE